jgi:hypothetical protein
VDLFILSQLGEGDVPIARFVCQQWNSLLKGKKALKNAQLTSHHGGLGSLSVFQWLFFEQIYMRISAAKGGYLHILQWLRKRLPLGYAHLFVCS